MALKSVEEVPDCHRHTNHAGFGVGWYKFTTGDGDCQEKKAFDF